MRTKTPILLAVAAMLASGCSPKPDTTASKYTFGTLSADKIAEIALLVRKDEWGESVELVPVAPPIRNPQEIADFVNATKLDLPVTPGTENLAGAVCIIVLLDGDGNVIQASTLFAADAVLGPSMATYDSKRGVYNSGTLNSGGVVLLPRKAPNFGHYVLGYLKQHNPQRYVGDWFIDM